jgi:hypothetical protein
VNIEFTAKKVHEFAVSRMSHNLSLLHIQRMGREKTKTDYGVSSKNCALSLLETSQIQRREITGVNYAAVSHWGVCCGRDRE